MMLDQIREAVSALIIPITKRKFSIYTNSLYGNPTVLWQEVGKEEPLKYQRFSKYGSGLPGCYFFVPKKVDNPPLELANMLKEINPHIEVFMLDGSVHMSLRPVGLNHGV